MSAPSPKPSLPDHIVPLTELDAVWRMSSAGERLREVRRAGHALRERLLATGKAACVRTFELMPFIYPTAYGFGGAAISPLPFLVMTNRTNLVQFETDGGETKTLLFNPTDYEKSAETPYFLELRRRFGRFFYDRFIRATKKPKPEEYLPTVGLRPEDVDYIAFDHMHVQDVREMLGAAGPPGGHALRAIYPRARILVWRPELDIYRALHPLQAKWYIRDAVRGVPDDRFIVCDGDVRLGKGVALVRTPGHTVGNWSLVVSTDSGVWAVSENGIGCDAYAPEASRIPGLKRHARREDVEVVMNSNTLELKNEQYTSMVLEKTLVDRCRDAPEFVQHFSSSELTRTPFTPGLGPTYRHGGITSGEVRKPASAGRAKDARPGAAAS